MMNSKLPLLEIDRTVFKKSESERAALKDLKRQHQDTLKNLYGENWRKYLKPVKL
jgi:hypothetical protein